MKYYYGRLKKEVTYTISDVSSPLKSEYIHTIFAREELQQISHLLIFADMNVYRSLLEYEKEYSKPLADFMLSSLREVPLEVYKKALEEVL